jgi:hypothetical protein
VVTWRAGRAAGSARTTVAAGTAMRDANLGLGRAAIASVTARA